jgi:Ca-activated chloride channel family protein
MYFVRVRLLVLAALVALLPAVARTHAVDGDQPAVHGDQSAVHGDQQPVHDQKPFKSGIELISITATVSDAEGHLITELPREAFEVFEDGEQQTITQFTNQRVPVGLGLLLDVSDSMFGKRIKDARAAVDRFLFDLLNPADEFFVFAFNHKPRPLTGWTRAQDEVQHALATVQPSGGTAIYDTIVESLPLIAKRTRERAAILVISDGEDNSSNATLRELESALLRSDAFVYAIAIDPPERHAINRGVNVETLREMTADSGGRTEVVRGSEDLAEATARIAEELNSQYVLGYSSSHPMDGRFHSIRVRATGYRVRARRGYVR